MHEKSLLAQKIWRDKKNWDPFDPLFLWNKKRCGKIKVRYYADGRPQRFLHEKDEATFPTVKTVSVILTAVQDAVEKRDVTITDITWAFLNAFLDKIVHMRIGGKVADSLIEILPSVYGPSATTAASGKTLLFVRLTRALYWTLKASMHFWE